MALYRRVLTGQVAPGQHGKFLAAVEEALEYQAQRGIDAEYSVWDSLTGSTSEVEICGRSTILSPSSTQTEPTRRPNCPRCSQCAASRTWWSAIAARR